MYSIFIHSILSCYNLFFSPLFFSIFFYFIQFYSILFYSRYKYMEFPVNLPTEPPPIKYMAKYAQFLRSDHARYFTGSRSTF